MSVSLKLVKFVVDYLKFQFVSTCGLVKIQKYILYLVQTIKVIDKSMLIDKDS